jgi:hypothetical protein
VQRAAREGTAHGGNEDALPQARCAKLSTKLPESPVRIRCTSTVARRKR